MALVAEGGKTDWQRLLEAYNKPPVPPMFPVSPQQQSPWGQLYRLWRQQDWAVAPGEAERPITRAAYEKLIEERVKRTPAAVMEELRRTAEDFTRRGFVEQPEQFVRLEVGDWAGQDAGLSKELAHLASQRVSPGIRERIQQMMGGRDVSVSPIKGAWLPTIMKQVAEREELPPDVEAFIRAGLMPEAAAEAIAAPPGGYAPGRAGSAAWDYFMRAWERATAEYEPLPEPTLTEEEKERLAAIGIDPEAYEMGILPYAVPKEVTELPVPPRPIEEQPTAGQVWGALKAVPGLGVAPRTVEEAARAGITIISQGEYILERAVGMPFFVHPEAPGGFYAAMARLPGVVGAGYEWAPVPEVVKKFEEARTDRIASKLREIDLPPADKFELARTTWTWMASPERLEAALDDMIENDLTIDEVVRKHEWPVAEAIGQIVTDPLTYVGVALGKYRDYRLLEKVRKQFVLKVAPELADAIDDIPWYKRAWTSVGGKVDDLNPFAVMAHSKARALDRHINSYMGMVISKAKTKDDAITLVRRFMDAPEKLPPEFGTFVRSPNADEVRKALKLIEIDTFDSLKPVTAEMVKQMALAGMEMPTDEFKVMDFLAELYDKSIFATNKLYDVKPVTSAERWAQGFKSYMADFYLGISPRAVIRNAAGNVTFLSWDGLMGMTAANQIDDYMMACFGFSPMQAQRGLGLAKEYAGPSRGVPIVHDLAEIGRKVYTGDTPLIGESWARYQGTYQAMRKFDNLYWRPGQLMDLSPFDDIWPHLTPSTKANLIAAWRQSLNADELVENTRRALQGGRMAAKYLDDAEEVSPGFVRAVQSVIDDATDAAGTLDQRKLVRGVDDLAAELEKRAAKAAMRDGVPPKVFEPLIEEVVPPPAARAVVEEAVPPPAVSRMAQRVRRYDLGEAQTRLDTLRKFTGEAETGKRKVAAGVLDDWAEEMGLLQRRIAGIEETLARGMPTPKEAALLPGIEYAEELRAGRPPEVAKRMYSTMVREQAQYGTSTEGFILDAQEMGRAAYELQMHEKGEWAANAWRKYVSADVPFPTRMNDVRRLMEDQPDLVIAWQDYLIRQMAAKNTPSWQVLQHDPAVKDIVRMLPLEDVQTLADVRPSAKLELEELLGVLPEVADPDLPADIGVLARHAGVDPTTAGYEEWERVLGYANERFRYHELRSIPEGLDSIAAKEAMRLPQDGWLFGEWRQMRVGRMSAKQEKAFRRSLIPPDMSRREFFDYHGDAAQVYFDLAEEIEAFLGDVPRPVRIADTMDAKALIRLEAGVQPVLPVVYPRPEVWEIPVERITPERLPTAPIPKGPPLLTDQELKKAKRYVELLREAGNPKAARYDEFAYTPLADAFVKHEVTEYDEIVRILGREPTVADLRTAEGMGAIDQGHQVATQKADLISELQRLTGRRISTVEDADAALASLKVSPGTSKNIVEEIALPGVEAVPAAIKEPWQLTREEFGTAAIGPFMREEPHPYATLIKQYEGEFRATQPVGRADIGDFVHRRIVEQAVAAGQPVPTEVLAEYPGLVGEAIGAARPAAKRPWEMTAKEYIDAAKRQAGVGAPAIPDRVIGDAHKETVARALSEGQPVPAAVLADYPDLAKAAEVAPAVGRVPDEFALKNWSDHELGRRAQAYSNRGDTDALHAVQEEFAQRFAGKQPPADILAEYPEVAIHPRGELPGVPRLEVAAAAPPPAAAPATVVTRGAVNRAEAAAVDLAADYKARGIERQAAYSRFVQDRNLKPEMDAKEFFGLYDQASPRLLEGVATEVGFTPTHFDTVTQQPVMVTGAEGQHKIVWQMGMEGGYPRREPLPERFVPIEQVAPAARVAGALQPDEVVKVTGTIDQYAYRSANEYSLNRLEGIIGTTYDEETRRAYIANWFDRAQTMAQPSPTGGMRPDMAEIAERVRHRQVTWSAYLEPTPELKPAGELLDQVNAAHARWLELKRAGAPADEIEAARVDLARLSTRFREAGGMEAVAQAPALPELKPGDKVFETLQAEPEIGTVREMILDKDRGVLYAQVDYGPGRALQELPFDSLTKVEEVPEAAAEAAALARFKARAQKKVEGVQEVIAELKQRGLSLEDFQSNLRKGIDPRLKGVTQNDLWEVGIRGFDELWQTTPPPAAFKQPWEMTGAEYAQTSTEAFLTKLEREAETAQRMPGASFGELRDEYAKHGLHVFKAKGKYVIQHPSGLEARLSVSEEALADVPARLKSWAKFARQTPDFVAGAPYAEHEGLVARALAEGREVPARVLADYPDLAAPAAGRVAIGPPWDETFNAAVARVESEPIASLRQGTVGDGELEIGYRMAQIAAGTDAPSLQAVHSHSIQTTLNLRPGTVEPHFNMKKLRARLEDAGFAIEEGKVIAPPAAARVPGEFPGMPRLEVAAPAVEAAEAPRFWLVRGTPKGMGPAIESQDTIQAATKEEAIAIAKRKYSKVARGMVFSAVETEAGVLRVEGGAVRVAGLTEAQQRALAVERGELPEALLPGMPRLEMGAPGVTRMEVPPEAARGEVLLGEAAEKYRRAEMAARQAGAPMLPGMEVAEEVTTPAMRSRRMSELSDEIAAFQKRGEGKVGPFRDWVDAQVARRQDEMNRLLAEALPKAAPPAPPAAAVPAAEILQPITDDQLSGMWELGGGRIEHVAEARRGHLSLTTFPDEGIAAGVGDLYETTAAGKVRALGRWSYEADLETGQVKKLWQPKVTGRRGPLVARADHPDVVALIESELRRVGLTGVPGPGAAPPAAVGSEKMAEAIKKGTAFTDDYGFDWKPVSPPETQLKNYIKVRTKIDGQDTIFYTYKTTAAKDQARILSAKLAEAVPTRLTPVIPEVAPALSKQAAGLRQKADAMASAIEKKRHPAIAGQRMTARRAGIAAGMAEEADALARIQAKLYAIADRMEAGTLPESLAVVKHKADVETLESMAQQARWAAQRANLPGALTRPLDDELLRFANMPRWEEDLKKLRKLGVSTEQDLRAILRDYASLEVVAGRTAEEIRLAELERSLIGRAIPGYFPTPRPLADEMVGLAGIEPGMKVLEPSAGKGNIAEAVLAARPGTDLSVIEWNRDLGEILRLKGFNVVDDDFLKHTGQYDRIIMNPPFEKGQDIDHVRHAYDQLEPGGRVVAIMSEGTFARSDAKATAFQEWLDEAGGYGRQLPPGSFRSSERPTGVATRLVVIDKPGVEGVIAAMDDAALQAHIGELRKAIDRAAIDRPGPLRMFPTDEERALTAELEPFRLEMERRVAERTAAKLAAQERAREAAAAAQKRAALAERAAEIPETVSMEAVPYAMGIDPTELRKTEAGWRLRGAKGTYFVEAFDPAEWEWFLVSSGNYKQMAESYKFNVGNDPLTVQELRKGVERLRSGLMPPYSAGVESAADAERGVLRRLLDDETGAVRLPGLPVAVPEVPGPLVAPELQEEIARRVFQNLVPARNDANMAKLQWAYEVVNRSLYDYDKRYEIDRWIGLFYPFHFWPTRTAYESSVRMLTKPWTVTSYYRIQKAIESINQDMGFPKRYGRTALPVPVPEGAVPEWAEPVAMIDLAPYIWPQTEVFPFNQLARIDWDDNDEAKTGLDRVADMQALWGMSPHWPLGYGLDMARGKEEEIGYVLPQTGVLRGLTAALKERYPERFDWIPPGGINIEKPFRTGLGLPLRPGYEDVYWPESMVLDMAATGEITPEERDAIVNPSSPQYHQGPIWDEAVNRAAILKQVPGLVSYMTGIRPGIVPKGEMKLREAAREELGPIYERERAGERGPEIREERSRWFRENPWYMGRGLLWTPGPEREVQFREREYIAARNDIYERYAAQLDSVPVWDNAARQPIFQTRQAELDRLDATYPDVRITPSFWGWAPGEIETYYEDSSLRPVADAYYAIRPEDYADDAGNANWAAFYKAREEFLQNVHDRAIDQGLLDKDALAEMGIKGKPSKLPWLTRSRFERYLRRNDDPKEALWKAYKDTVIAPARDRMYAEIAEAQEKERATPSQVYERYYAAYGPRPATDFITRVLAMYPEKGWAFGELEREYQGITLPGLKEVQELGRSPREEAIADLWDFYVALPTLDKKRLREDLGERFARFFVAKDTRNYNVIGDEELIYWMTYTGLDPGMLPEMAEAGGAPARVAEAQQMVETRPERRPTPPPTFEVTPQFIPSDPAVSAEYQRALDERSAMWQEIERQWPGYSEWSDLYSALQPWQVEERDALKEVLQPAWDFRRKYLEAHPLIEKWLYSEPSDDPRADAIADLWNFYMALSALDKRRLKDELGDRFSTYFVNKDSRNYDKISTEELTAWLGYVGLDSGLGPLVAQERADAAKAWTIAGKPIPEPAEPAAPAPTPAARLAPAPGTDVLQAVAGVFSPSSPNVSAEYDQAIAERDQMWLIVDTLWPDYSAMMDAYNGLKWWQFDEREALKVALDPAWRFMDEWKLAHPTMTKWLYPTWQPYVPKEKAPAAPRARKPTQEEVLTGEAKEWEAFAKTVEDPSLLELIQSWLLLSPAQRDAFVARYPKLAAWLKGKDAAWLAKLAASLGAHLALRKEKPRRAARPPTLRWYARW